ncbi:MAG: Gfo/Idh/MocA family protein [Planctomycetota bacterium]|jgi:predicted dehydrogenase
MNKQAVTRRDFVKGAVAASAVYSLLPSSVLGANDRVNVGVIGVGRKGSGHLKGFGGIENVDVVAVSDPDLTHMDMKDYTGAKHQDFRTLLMKEIDAVVIATPDHWHSLAAITACQAGKHVYVEKPVSHNIWEGRQMVTAARKYNRIVQAGTQQRSCPAVQECAKDVQAGKYGKVLWAHTSELGARQPIGKVDGPVEVPVHIDYDLWSGPAPLLPIMRTKFHYDWHWQWPWGTGQMGNWGVHYLDDLRHILGWDDVPTRIQAAGNRWWDDDGQTPNMHICLMEHRGVKVVVDIRNMADPAGRGGNSGSVYLRSRGGNYIMCENGFIKISRGGGKSYDPDGKMIKQYKGTGGIGHDVNFIDAVRQGSKKTLNGEIEIGHQSTVMCHQANVSWRIGSEVSVDEVRENMKHHDDAAHTIESVITQLNGNGVDLKNKPFVMGPKLTYDTVAEKFTGTDAAKANQYLRREYRRPFIITDDL